MTSLRKALADKRKRREQRHDITVLACLIFGDRHYLPIWRRTGLGAGAVYPALARLEHHGLIVRHSSGAEDERGWLGYTPTDEALALFTWRSA